MAKEVKALSDGATGAAAGSKLGPWGAVAGGALGLIGGLLGGGGDADAGEARNQANIAAEILRNLEQVPDISKPLVLEKYKQAGILTPEMEQYISAQVPQTIKTDPRLKDAQLNALKIFQDRADQGLTAGDRAALSEARQAAQGDVTSRLASIDQQMQSRGLADSGNSLAMKLAAAQGGANRASSDANQLAMQSQNAAMQAASQLGNLGSQMQGQEFNQALQNQEAQNQMQRFNIQNQIGQQSRNVANSNQAQQFNLTNLQGINNMNTQQGNQEQANQLNRQMQEWNAKADRARLQAGGASALSGTLQKSSDQANQGSTNMWGGISQIGSGIVDGLTKKFDGGIIQEYRHGGEIQATSPNQHPEVPGDSPQNDKIPIMATKGEIIVPRTLSKSPFGKHLLKVIDAHNNLKKHLNGDE